METWKRVCIKSLTITDKIGQFITIERGREYITSRAENGKVTVFSKFWVEVPASNFAGEEKFT